MSAQYPQGRGVEAKLHRLTYTPQEYVVHADRLKRPQLRYETLSIFLNPSFSTPISCFLPRVSRIRLLTSKFFSTSYSLCVLRRVISFLLSITFMLRVNA